MKKKEEIIAEIEKPISPKRTVDKIMDQCFEAGRSFGFEEFRVKVEEGVKKLPVEHSFKQPSFIRSTAQTIVSIEKRLVLTTIREIKQ